MKICVLDENNIIINILESPCCFEKNHRIFYDWNILGELYSDVEPLDHAKAQYTIAAGMEFAKRRDATTYVTQSDGVTVCGYDRQTEDIVNFMAARERAKLSESVPYKVYLLDGSKALVEHTLDMFDMCLNQSATEQLVAYAWYEDIKAQITACTTEAELDAITW